MGARAGNGSSAGLRRAKDANMAAAMKKAGIERREGRCPICHTLKSLGGMYNHIATCKNK